MEDNTTDLITQDTFTWLSGLLFFHSPSSSSCDLIELSRELANKKKQKSGSDNKQKSTSTTTNSAPLKKTASYLFKEMYRFPCIKWGLHWDKRTPQKAQEQASETKSWSTSKIITEKCFLSHILQYESFSSKQYI